MNLLKISFIVLPLFLINHHPLKALPLTAIQGTASGKNQTRIPAVHQLSHITTNHWSLQYLKNLDSRYQCFRDQETLEQLPPVITRYHFAILFKQCLHTIQQTNHSLNKKDIATIQRLKQDFALNLSQLKNKIQTLENQVNQLEKQSSSSQVELEGEAILAIAQVTDGTNNTNLTLGNRVRLDFITSFTDQDELKITLQGRSIPEFEEITGTNMANLGFDGADENEVEIEEISYELLLSSQTKLVLYPIGGGLGNLIPTVNPLFSGSGDGAISTFGRENPIRRQTEGTAISLSHDLSEQVNVAVGYVSSDANNTKQGLLQTPYGAITQLTFLPNGRLNLSLTYGYTTNNVGTGTGSALAENPFTDSNQIIAHSYGGEISLVLQPNITLGGRVGWIKANAKDLSGTPQADIFTWAIMLGVDNFMKEDSLFGFIFGQPPKVIKHDLGGEFEDPNTAYHVEIFYRWQLTDQIAITPGFFSIFNPEHNNKQDPILVGTIRTTFEF